VKKLATLIVAGGAVALLVAAFAPAAAVETYTVSATLRKTAEVPRPKGAAFARGTFSGKYVEHGKTATLTWKLTFSRLTGAAVAAHIHAGKRGVAGPVIVPLCGPCRNGQVGKVTITEGTISKLESGNAYVNVHTAKNAAGEIRGQVAAKS
jgi:CHRD domain-containing protein